MCSFFSDRKDSFDANTKGIHILQKVKNPCKVYVLFTYILTRFVHSFFLLTVDYPKAHWQRVESHKEGVLH